MQPARSAPPAAPTPVPTHVFLCCRLPPPQWDVSFWAERLKEAKYALEEEQLRPYFALPNVLEVRRFGRLLQICRAAGHGSGSLLAAGCWQAHWQALAPVMRAATRAPRLFGSDRRLPAPHLQPARPQPRSASSPPAALRPSQGLFGLAKRLFDVDIEPADGKAPVWHEDVRFFVVKKGGRPKAYFYLDPYSRPSEKRGGAW